MTCYTKAAMLFLLNKVEAHSQFKALVGRYCDFPYTDIEKIFGIYYLHLKCSNGDDLFITKYGLPFTQNLQPESFLTDKSWYQEHSSRLSGSGCTLRVRTKQIDGISKVIVLKWNRMGQEIPADDEESAEFEGAEFNSPFEEFSLVSELRDSKYESPGTIIAQKPLAIYVPSQRQELWRMGRKESLIQKKLAKHVGIMLDKFRSYATIYEWVKGMDAATAFQKNLINEKEMVSVTLEAESEMKYKGFFVRDRKPHHIILKPRTHGAVARRRDGGVLYAVIDYELLERTTERDRAVKKARRSSYLIKQKDRFVERQSDTSAPQLKQVKLHGVDYIYGHVESTNGLLWAVGKDPDLFDYYLPERWEKQPRTKLSSSHEIYYTLTKDNIHLVWKISKIGTLPDVDPFRENERKILEYGFNSPFEEISIALELTRKGIRTVYPRAIYMFGQRINLSDSISDDRRYISHQKQLTPEGTPILLKNHTYIIIWGYWNGPDERLASKDDDYLEGISALNAYRQGMLSEREYIDLLKKKKQRLARIGIEDLNLHGTHILLSMDIYKKLVKDSDGMFDMRVCNFELLRRCIET